MRLKDGAMNPGIELLRLLSFGLHCIGNILQDKQKGVQEVTLT
jgi:hypothetical protein